MPALGKLSRPLIACALSATFAMGCQRQAPGPEECARFAEAVVGNGLYITPVIAAQIETQTQECLTRPYDRELLRCVILTRQASVCLASFRARTARDQELPE